MKSRLFLPRISNMGYGPKYGLILKWSGYRYSVLTYIFFLKAVDIIKKKKQEKIGMRNKIMDNTIKMVREKMGILKAGKCFKERLCNA